jgi:hypothetical protein
VRVTNFAEQVRYVSEGSRKILELDSKTVLERSQQLIEKKKRLQEVCMYLGYLFTIEFVGEDLASGKRRKGKGGSTSSCNGNQIEYFDFLIRSLQDKIFPASHQFHTQSAGHTHTLSSLVGSIAEHQN